MSTMESRWIEQTSDELRAAGRRRFVKKLSFTENGAGRSLHIETVTEARKMSPPEDSVTDELYDWLEAGADNA